MAKREFPLPSKDNKGQYPAYALGGYPILYYTLAGDTLCAACASKDADDLTDPVTMSDVYWEGPVDWCVECGGRLESAYGGPNDSTQAL